MWTQNTGAPISRSRNVPPPTPVTTAKKMKVTRVCLFSAASSAPEIGEHGDAEIVEQDERGGKGMSEFRHCEEWSDEAIESGSVPDVRHFPPGRIPPSVRASRRWRTSNAYPLLGCGLGVNRHCGRRGIHNNA